MTKPTDNKLNTKAAGIVGLAVMCSRILGLVREQVFAALFGGGRAMDAFTVAFRTPNLLRDMFAEGALSTAFVTTFSKKIATEGDESVRNESWGFVQEDTFASKGQKMIYHGWLKPLEKPLLQSPLVPWSYFASNFYHNVYWYPFIGRKRVQAALKTQWGQLFENYGNGQVVMPGVEPKTVIQAGVGLTALAALAGGLAWLLVRNRKKS